MNPKDLKIESWPQYNSGMLTGEIDRGVKITHLPTGLSVVCTMYREQHRNRERALKDLGEELDQLGRVRNQRQSGQGIAD